MLMKNFVEEQQASQLAHFQQDLNAIRQELYDAQASIPAPQQLSEKLANLDVQSLFSEEKCVDTEKVWMSQQYNFSKANAHEAARKAGLKNIEELKTYKCEQKGERFELEMKVYTPEMKKFCSGKGDCKGVMEINDIRDHCLVEGFGCDHREQNLVQDEHGPRDMLPGEEENDPRKWADKYWGKIIEKDEKLEKQAKDAAKEAWKKKLAHDKKLMEKAKREAKKAWEKQQKENAKLKDQAKKQAKKTWKRWQKEQEKLGEQAKKEADKAWKEYKKKQEAKKDKKDEGKKEKK